MWEEAEEVKEGRMYNKKEATENCLVTAMAFMSMVSALVSMTICKDEAERYEFYKVASRTLSELYASVLLNKFTASMDVVSGNLNNADLFSNAWPS